MRFIIDAQLPPALARWMADAGHQAEHVTDIDLGSAKDSAIWAHALQTGAAIVTKDEDFVTRLAMEPDGPPIVWIRIGNTRKQALLQWFAPLLPTILKALASGENLVEVV